MGKRILSDVLKELLGLSLWTFSYIRCCTGTSK